MLDLEMYRRPIAHRGLHDASCGVIENTAPAFEAAIAKGFGIECDLRPAANGLPVVFHDLTLDRLCEQRGALARLGASNLKSLRFRGSPTTGVPSFAALLELVAGRTPLFVEIKSEWKAPDGAFLRQIAALALDYPGPIAIMSFDPAVVAAIRELAPGLPRGVVSGSYRGAGWRDRNLSFKRARALRTLSEMQPGDAHFFAYEVGALPTPATEYARRVRNLPVLTWTVRTEKDRARATQWADQIIFEGFEP
ncbi:MAG: glycerophosphodiester phosphodiesterase family protein [Hyphomicrobium sp.]